ncbi:hypothetical protein [Caudoviricetes sp.]|nr:hypothetical protein [Caudoviricetes sp.]
MATTTTTQIDPTIQPFLSYGLQQAQQQYQAGGPQYYGGQTYVSPSSATQTGLQALEARATAGNPLLGQAQTALGDTLSGNYLGGNPFFQGAFAPAAQAAQQQFTSTIGDIASKSSLAGRYGSGAMGNLQDRATGQFAQSLANTAGNLAYQNYEAERARQQQAMGLAPTLAQSDYQDIQNLLQAGQIREGYTGQQQQADIAKFNFLQNAPQQNLANYLNAVYGNPLGTSRSQTTSGTADTSTLQNLLGIGATAAGIYKSPELVSDISSGWNWLTSGWGG